ncbi:hypothetical protein Ocin01_09514 [Orchesella cincta]|uniref:Uncharacterized protein n=1 Tax=Orchesella cincta TaxID=48709 RepID=A0A1D2MVR8_ORCCI|nr:hypothetical protein Ocin01_09514 [Orchesella cincta]
MVGSFGSLCHLRWLALLLRLKVKRTTLDVRRRLLLMGSILLLERIVKSMRVGGYGGLEFNGRDLEHMESMELGSRRFSFERVGL